MGAKLHREIIINTAIKFARGTKRICQTCETRFYDLARDPIVCPACSALYVVTQKPTVAESRTGSLASKTAWRSKPLKRPSLPAEAEDVEEATAETSSDATDEVQDAGPDDDLVLEQEPDDGDVANLIDKVEEPKEG